MNQYPRIGPERMTLSMADIAPALGASIAGVRKWLLGSRHPIHFAHGGGAARAFMRPDDVIVRLRKERKRGCDTADAVKLLRVDAERRTAEPTLPLGGDAHRRVRDLKSAMTDAEHSRYHVIRGLLHSALVRALWSDAWRSNIPELLDAALIHPSITLYVLGDEPSELPQTHDQWTHWANAFATVNLYSVTTPIQKAA